MMAGLHELGVPFFPSHANFVLMKIGPKHKELVKAMRAHGVLLRDRSTDPGCDGFVRITIGVEEHVTRGLDGIEGFVWMRLDGQGSRLANRRDQRSGADEREFE